MGVIFTIREFDEDALEWVLPRVERYVKVLRQKSPEIHLAMMSHGDELAAASSGQQQRFPAMHRLLEKLSREYGFVFHVCNTAARGLGLDEDDFPAYVNVVPFGPSQVQDYLSMGYELVDLELTW
jgi:intracellular sulfur oxidation DsrE/DsrF family protein